MKKLISLIILLGLIISFASPHNVVASTCHHTPITVSRSSRDGCLVSNWKAIECSKCGVELVAEIFGSRTPSGYAHVGVQRRCNYRACETGYWTVTECKNCGVFIYEYYTGGYDHSYVYVSY